REHGLPPRRARHERSVGIGGGAAAPAGARGRPTSVGGRRVAATGCVRRGLAPRRRPVARRCASDPRLQRDLQDAAAAPSRRLPDHRRRRQAGGYADVAPPDTEAASGPAPVTAAAGGPVWGAASADLNATLLEWPAEQGPAEHVNDQRDVLYVVLTGSVTLTV